MSLVAHGLANRGVQRLNRFGRVMILRTSAPYRTAAGKAWMTAYESGGNPEHLVFIEFGGSPEQAVVRVEGDPARVRALVDATDLKSIAAFR
ncbi:MAG TPA: hypothetical protein VFX69_01955, partial [Steroidobacteraceae bacterium]|nr:hypothetical protein [Steroidobacteraceae bacterium]